MSHLRLFPFLLLVSPLFFAGCASPVGDSANAFDHYLNEEVSMQIQTPDGAAPADGVDKEVVLPKGTRVRLIERGSNMSLVETMKGQRGQVPAIDLEATDENQGDEPQAKMGKTIQW